MRKGRSISERIIILLSRSEHIVKKLHPHWLLLENVPTMDQTVIMNEKGEPINIIEYVQEQLGDEYVGKAEKESSYHCSGYE